MNMAISYKAVLDLRKHWNADVQNQAALSKVPR